MPKLRSQRVVIDGEVRPATIRHEQGVIVEVGDGTADEDFGDLVILPGLVDCHVHVNEPGRTEWEGFATATSAAVAGGCTTIVDMPLNSIPSTVTAQALQLKRAAAASQVLVDVAFWGGITPGSEGSISDLIAEGVCGFKAFLVDSGVPEFPPVSIDTLMEVAPRLAGRPLLVHAEDPGSLQTPEGDPRSYSTYLASRPPRAERRAIEEMVAVAGITSVHVLHVAGAEAVDAIRIGRLSGTMTAETCPHYLTFEASSIPDRATVFKCAPPIRTAEDREALWDALGSGLIEMVVSDHSPAPPALKDPGHGDFLQAWGGIASLELRLPATWDGARRRGHGVESLADWLARAPARLAGLDRKGSIAPGHDADFAVFDPEGVTEVDAHRMRQRHPLTPYDGMRLAGSVVATYLAGIYMPGRGDAPPARGRLIRAGG